MELHRGSAIESTPRTREGSTSALGSGAHGAGDQVERRRLQVVDQLGLGERSVQHPLQRRLLDHRDPSPQVEPHDGRGLIEPHDVGHDHDDGVAGAFEHVSQQIVGSGVAGDRRVARRLLLDVGDEALDAGAEADGAEQVDGDGLTAVGLTDASQQSQVRLGGLELSLGLELTLWFARPRTDAPGTARAPAEPLASRVRER